MRIAIVGDYDPERPSHIATSECIRATGRYLGKQIEFRWFPTLPFEEKSTLAELQEFNGIWGAPGDHNSHLGMVNAIQFSRESDIPYLGT